MKDSFIVREIYIYIYLELPLIETVCRKKKKKTKKKLKIFISPVFIPSVSNVRDSLFILNVPRSFPLIVKLGSQRFNQPSSPSFRLSSRHFFTAWLKTGCCPVGDTPGIPSNRSSAAATSPFISIDTCGACNRSPLLLSPPPFATLISQKRSKKGFYSIEFFTR